MNFLDSCRFCIQKVNINERIEITFSHRSKFKDLTNTELINSEFYSKLSCYDCLKKLDSCLEVKNEFISKQDYLLNTCHQSVGGILQDHFVDTKNFLGYQHSIESVVKIEQDDYEVLSIKKEAETEMLNTIEYVIPEDSSIKEVVTKTSNKNDKEKAESTSPDLVECPYCFKLVINLKVHKQKSHKTEIARKPRKDKRSLKRLPCQFCGLMFSAFHINQHVDRIHRKIKRYFCDYCTMSFYFKEEILKHFSVHIYSDPVQCAVCSQFYRSKNYLKFHMKAMHMEKTFICDFETKGIKCGKQYESASKLKRHSDNNHRYVKRYPCEYAACQQSYTDIRDLDYHEYTVHLNMRIKCDLCPTLTTSKKDYKRHINLHHKELDKNDKKNVLDKITSTDHKSLFNYRLTADDLKKCKNKKKSCKKR